MRTLLGLSVQPKGVHHVELINNILFMIVIVIVYHENTLFFILIVVPQD
jgi:hypothetical protein